MRWAKTGVAFGVMVCILVIFYLHVLGTERFLGFEENEDGLLAAVRIIVSATALVTGIVFGTFHRMWRERKEPLDFASVKAGFRSAELWRSLLAAPLVFSGVYAAARTQPDFIMAFFLAFQTGFFTDAVLQGKMREVMASSDPK